MSTRNLLITLAILVACIGAACASAPTPAPAAPPVITRIVVVEPSPAPITHTDAAGRKVTLTALPQRIISLAPSNTEILFALDLGSRTIAVDDLSDYPAQAKSLTKIGGSRGTYNFEQIVALKPDLVLAAGITPAETIKRLEDLKLAVAVVSDANTTLDGTIASIVLVGKMTGKSDKASTITDAMKQKLQAIKTKVAAAKTKPRVFWELDATDPTKPFTVGPGNFVNDLITLAGGTNVFANAGKPYPQVSSEQIVSANPEVIILSDAAYGITVDSVLKRAGWQNIAAVRNKRVYPIDDDLVSRPGPRLVDGLEAAAKLIHPDLFK